MFLELGSCFLDSSADVGGGVASTMVHGRFRGPVDVTAGLPGGVARPATCVYVNSSSDSEVALPVVVRKTGRGRPPSARKAPSALTRRPAVASR